MTSNPQSRRPATIEIHSHPSLTPSIISYINHRIQRHEIQVAIISSLIGIPLTTYILWQLHTIKSHLPV